MDRHPRGITRRRERKETVPYREPIEAVVAELGSGPQRGLSAPQANVRLERYGRNEIEPEKPVPAGESA